MTPRLAPGLLLAALLLSAGCLGDTPQPASDTQAPKEDATRPVVVALIDSGINPFHEAFRAGTGTEASEWAEAFGAEVITPRAREVLPDGGASGADEGVWGGIEEGKLYAFAGTRVLALSFGRDDADALPILDAAGHGVGVASLVAREAPGALIVMVQVDTSYCLEDCASATPFSPAMEWVADQPWIDVVSVSLGELVGAPKTPPFDADAGRYVKAAQRAAESGKLLVAAAGNLLAPSLPDYVVGPPWIIAVGGAHEKPRGEATYASKSVELVANYTEWTASRASDDAMKWSHGTSYAAPVVAGVLAHAWGRIMERLQGERPDPLAMREALHAAAVAFASADWNPTKFPTNETSGHLSSTSVPVLAPFVQMGWGYVDGHIADEIARRVLENDLEPPAEKATTAQYMAEWQSLREEYWSRQPFS